MSKRKTQQAERSAIRQFDHITNSQLEADINVLQHMYNPELARQVIEVFHDRMEDIDNVDLQLLFALMKPVFARIIDEGRTADQAFGLKPIRGQYEREDTFSRDIRAAAIVEVQRHKGLTWEDAVTDAAEIMQISSRTVERAYEQYSSGLQMPYETLLQIAGEDLPPA